MILIYPFSDRLKTLTYPSRLFISIAFVMVPTSSPVSKFRAKFLDK